MLVQKMLLLSCIVKILALTQATPRNLLCGTRVLLLQAVVRVVQEFDLLAAYKVPENEKPELLVHFTPDFPAGD